MRYQEITEEYKVRMYPDTTYDEAISYIARKYPEHIYQTRKEKASGLTTYHMLKFAKPNDANKALANLNSMSDKTWKAHMSKERPYTYIKIDFKFHDNYVKGEIINFTPEFGDIAKAERLDPLNGHYFNKAMSQNYHKTLVLGRFLSGPPKGAYFLIKNMSIAHKDILVQYNPNGTVRFAGGTMQI